MCALSNGYVADDLGWLTPNPPNHPNFSIFRRLSYLCSWVNVEISNLVHMLVVASPIYGLQTDSERGVVIRHMTHFKFGGPIGLHKSLMAEARAVKFCTLV